ncbi:hypothetical protein D3C74_418010 [compost metagenome]
MLLPYEKIVHRYHIGFIFITAKYHHRENLFLPLSLDLCEQLANVPIDNIKRSLLICKNSIFIMHFLRTV